MSIMTEIRGFFFYFLVNIQTPTNSFSWASDVVVVVVGRHSIFEHVGGVHAIIINYLRLCVSSL